MSELDNIIFGLECIAGKEKWCKDCHFAQPNGSGWPNKCHKAIANKAIELLKEKQPIIRCKDCRNSKVTKRIEGKYRDCPILCADVDEDFYCGFGKAKDGEQE